MEIARGIELQDSPTNYRFVPGYPRFYDRYCGVWKGEVIDKMKNALKDNYPSLIGEYERMGREDMYHPFKANIALGLMKAREGNQF